MSLLSGLDVVQQNVRLIHSLTDQVDFSPSATFAVLVASTLVTSHDHRLSFRLM